MPFIQELKDGTLPLPNFQFYMQQDARYLEYFGRVLSFIGSKSNDNQQALDFFEFGTNALVVEKALHETYFKDFGVNHASADSGMQPACHHYVHFLQSTAAFCPIEVAIAAVLPCFWIYKEVGDYIYANCSVDNNQYKAWIETYSGDDFADGVKRAIEYANRAASQSTPAIREQMWRAFEVSTRLEFEFWNAAYNLRRW